MSELMDGLRAELIDRPHPALAEAVAAHRDDDCPRCTIDDSEPKGFGPVTPFDAVDWRHENMLALWLIGLASRRCECACGGTGRVEVEK